MKIINFLEKLSENLIPFFLHPSPTGWLLAIKITFLVFAVFFATYIIWALFRTSWLDARFLINLIEFFSYRSFEIRGIKRDWQKIKNRLETGLESEYKLAVIEADELFNDVLKKMGYQGETLGEKLEKLTPDILSNLEEIRQAHRVRNNIIHDPNYQLSLEEAARILNIFEKALQNLDAF